MIIQSIFDSFFNKVISFLNTIPSVTFPQGFTDALVACVNVMVKINYFVDLRVVAVCIVTLIAFYNFSFIMSISNYIFRKILGR